MPKAMVALRQRKLEVGSLNSKYVCCLVSFVSDAWYIATLSLLCLARKEYTFAVVSLVWQKMIVLGNSCGVLADCREVARHWRSLCNEIAINLIIH